MDSSAGSVVLPKVFGRAALVAPFFLAGCYTVNIERMMIQTVGASCEFDRGAQQQTDINGNANLVSREGGTDAFLSGMMRSSVRCPDGTEVSADAVSDERGAAR